MLKKGYILALIIALSQVIFILIQMALYDHFYISNGIDGLGSYSKTLAHFLFVLRLVFPIILITQLNSKISIKSLGVFMIVIAVLNYLTTSFAFGTDIYSIFGIIISVLSIIGYTIFVFWTIYDSEIKNARIFLLLLLIMTIYFNPLIHNMIEISGISILITNAFVGIFLYNVVLVFEMIYIIKESNKVIREDDEYEIR